ncbi:MAG TPA: hydroxymethylglutaryl-CoA lyase [Phycisphaerales bacterium]|nr:hydroxymethylglutaryl-CoA lyase [Phycisphaerales bacterium]
MPGRVRLTDVSPRDGLQNEPATIPTAEKLRLIELLCRAGLDEIEVTSFVSPKAVPQLADAADLCDGLAALLQGQRGRGEGNPGTRAPAPVFSALTPNLTGLGGALEANTRAQGRLIGRVGVFTAASEEFCRRNINATIAESLLRFAPVIERAHAEGLGVRGYISCVIACPFQGPVAPGEVVRVAEGLLGLGVDELDLGDTIGAATPESTERLLTAYARVVPLADDAPGARVRTTLHLHDTRGRAADCVRTALGMGVRSFDGSVAGLGGCPYASRPGGRAPGNIATELLMRTVEEAGYSVGADAGRLALAGEFARALARRARADGAEPGTSRVVAEPHR